MSNFLSSNRILKSSYINYDKARAVPVDNENPALKQQRDEPDDFDEFDFFSHPGQAYENDLRAENEDIDEAALAERIVARAKEEADRIIQSARDDADLILDRMEQDAEDKINRREAEARDRGYAEGFDRGEAETEGIKQEARKVYENAVEERRESFGNFEPEIVDLIMDTLVTLLTKEININPQVILYLIRKGFSQSRLSGDVVIRVSGDDYEEAVANQSELLQLVDAGAKLEIIKDFSLKKTDCIIETPFGMIDCSLEQQYEALKKNLYFIFENR